MADRKIIESTRCNNTPIKHILSLLLLTPTNQGQPFFQKDCKSINFKNNIKDFFMISLSQKST